MPRELPRVRVFHARNRILSDFRSGGFALLLVQPHSHIAVRCCACAGLWHCIEPSVSHQPKSEPLQSEGFELGTRRFLTVVVFWVPSQVESQTSAVSYFISFSFTLRRLGVDSCNAAARHGLRMVESHTSPSVCCPSPSAMSEPRNYSKEVRLSHLWSETRRREGQTLIQQQPRYEN